MDDYFQKKTALKNIKNKIKKSYVHEHGWTGGAAKIQTLAVLHLQLLLRRQCVDEHALAVARTVRHVRRGVCGRKKEGSKSVEAERTKAAKEVC